jgi:hypothetical protein
VAPLLGRKRAAGRRWNAKGKATVWTTPPISATIVDAPNAWRPDSRSSVMAELIRLLIEAHKNKGAK